MVKSIGNMPTEQEDQRQMQQLESLISFMCWTLEWPKLVTRTKLQRRGEHKNWGETGVKRSFAALVCFLFQLSII